MGWVGEVVGLNNSKADVFEHNRGEKEKMDMTGIG